MLLYCIILYYLVLHIKFYYMMLFLSCSRFPARGGSLLASPQLRRGHGCSDGMSGWVGGWEGGWVGSGRHPAMASPWHRFLDV